MLGFLLFFGARFRAWRAVRAFKLSSGLPQRAQATPAGVLSVPVAQGGNSSGEGLRNLGNILVHPPLSHYNVYDIRLHNERRPRSSSRKHAIFPRHTLIFKENYVHLLSCLSSTPSIFFWAMYGS